MSADTFEHGADIGVIGRGATLAEAFCGAAEAMFAIMIDLEQVQPKETVRVAFDEDDLDLALVRWLNILIAEARVRGLVFIRFRLVQDKEGKWRGEADGEPWRLVAPNLAAIK